MKIIVMFTIWIVIIRAIAILRLSRFDFEEFSGILTSLNTPKEECRHDATLCDCVNCTWNAYDAVLRITTEYLSQNNCSRTLVIKLERYFFKIIGCSLKSFYTQIPTSRIILVWLHCWLFTILSVNVKWTKHACLKCFRG